MRRVPGPPGVMAVVDLDLENGRTIPAGTHGMRVHRPGLPWDQIEIEWETRPVAFSLDPGPDFDGIERY